MKHRLIPALTLAAALAFSAALARADDPDTSFVRQHALDMLEGALVPDQVTTLQLVAYQAAIAATCDGFVLDDEKFEKVFGTLAPQDPSKLSDEQKTYYDQHLLVVYGVLVGGELAAISDDLSDACAAAEEDRKDETMTDVRVWE